MPILLVLLTAAACSPLPWPEASFSHSPPLAAVFMVLGGLLSAGAVRFQSLRTLRKFPDAREQILKRYVRIRKWINWLELFSLLPLWLVFGWGHYVWTEWTVTIGARTALFPFAELFVPLPFFVAILSEIPIFHAVEREIHRTAPERTGEFWRLRSYLLHRLRILILTLGLPISVYTAEQSLGRFCPTLVDSVEFTIGSGIVAIGVFLFLPLAVKPLLGLRSFPTGSERDNLETIVQRLGYRFTDLLEWPTQKTTANAMVVGVIPWARYVIVTDRLVHELTQAELGAVLGHEIGHVRFRHIPFYMLFLTLSFATGGLLGALAEQWASPGESQTITELRGTLLPVIFVGIWIYVVFGMLSRRCERQADVFGCRAVSCGHFHCTGHDSETILTQGGQSVCKTGVAIMIEALDKVGRWNGYQKIDSSGTWFGRWKVWLRRLRSWQHGPIHERIEFLLQLSSDPTLADKTDQIAFRFRWRAVLLLLLMLLTLAWLCFLRESTPAGKFF